MVPFGTQQEILRDLSTSSPEELSGNCRRLFIEGGVVVITIDKSAWRQDLLCEIGACVREMRQWQCDL